MAIAIAHNRGGIPPRADMFSSALPSNDASHAILLAGLCLAALAVAGVLYRRMAATNRQLANALNNMSQGLCMFDSRGRIVLCNTRYIEMYKLSTKIVRPGCTLRELIAHRQDTGLFSGNVDEYCRNIMDHVANGQRTEFYVPGSDGHIVHAKNEPLPGGGWVVTHEDVTEQRHAEQ